MEELLDAAIHPVRARLKNALKQTDPHVLVAVTNPRVVERFQHAFNPRTKRPSYPTSHTVYRQEATNNELGSH